MKKIRMAFLALTAFALLATSTGCGGGGGGGSDDDVVTPVAENGGAGGSGSGSSGSGSGSSGSGGGSTSTSIPAGFVAVPGATFDGTTAITGSKVFISGRTITIPNLLVCDHEVTQGEYEQYCEYGGSQPDSTCGDGDNYPAYRVSWYDAITYCNKRSLAENLTPCYTVSGIDFSGNVTVPSSHNATWESVECNFSANGYRLPTEAEWEYLARGGNLTNSGQTTYSGNGGIGNLAWYMNNAYNVGESNPNYGTHQVRTKNPNEKTLYDMSGNVKEWCWDRYNFRDITASTPSTGVELGSNRVTRGGGWISHASYCTVSYRGDCGGPEYRNYNTIGFRVVCSRSE